MSRISKTKVARFFAWSLFLGVVLCTSVAVAATNLPAQYFELLNTGVARIEKRLMAEPAADLQTLESLGSWKHFPSAILAASVLYTQPHPANARRGDAKLLTLAQQIGDLLASEHARGYYTTRLDHHRDTYMWLEGYRLLEGEMSVERRERWRGALTNLIAALAGDVSEKQDYPWYQSPFISTSPNHYALWAKTVFLGGKVFGNEEWQRLGARVLHRFVTGPDGRIYGTGTRGNQVGLYIYDPKLGKVVRDFGAVGPKHPNGAWSRYVMGVDDTHAYIASGMIPAWYLVAVNLQTGEQKVLLESPSEKVMDIIESFPSAYARVPQDGGSNKEYWLYHGETIPKVNDKPPWPKQNSPWAKAVPKPEVYFDQIDPDENGKAVVWYRPHQEADSRSSRRKEAQTSLTNTPENKSQSLLTSAATNLQAQGWKSIRLEGVNTYPHRINPLAVLPDGRLYGTGDDYVGTFLFNPRIDETIYCGPRVGLAPYTTILCDGKLYLSGYSGGHLFVYDPARPWTLGKGGPPGDPAPNQGDARSNPRYLGDFDRTTRVGLMHSSALGADGRIYFGGFGLRHYTGGGVGWFDPKTGKLDGFWRPLSGYAVQWIALALDGKLIVISTTKAADELNNNQAPEEAKLFVYDVSAQKIVREIAPVAKARTTGLITEAAPGRLLGLTTSGTERGKPGSGLLYGVDVTSGEVLFRKLLPSAVSTDDYWPHWVDPSYEYLDLARGPDGFIWTYLKNVLVRIDPADASVHVVGKIDPVGHPTFIGNDLYLSGPEQLRRIRKIATTR